jgi:hypothetical protein
MRAWPSPKFAVFNATIFGETLGNPHYWDVIASIVAGFPDLSAQGIAGYGYIVPNYTGVSSPFPYALDAFTGTFGIPLLFSTNTSDSLTAAFTTLIDSALAPYPGEFVSTMAATTYPDFYSWNKIFNGPQDAGYDLILGSRFLTPAQLKNKKGIIEAFKTYIPPISGSASTLHLVSGKGVWGAKPRGGGNSVNPAWRKSLVHATTSITFPPLDAAARVAAEKQMTNVMVPAIKKLAPDTGSYINEGDVNEPDPQATFWGKEYAKLLSMKRRIDPTAVFWCEPCVGNERWKVVGDLLCQK